MMRVELCCDAVFITLTFIFNIVINKRVYAIQFYPLMVTGLQVFVL